jgi:hypothetical protein
VDEEEDNNIQWKKQYATIKLINISTIIPLAHDNLTIEIHPRY